MEIFKFSQADVVLEPYPHVAARPFLADGLYEALKREFPADHFFDSAKGPGSRAGRDLYRGDLDFESFLEGSATWREFYSRINSPEFMHFTLSLFGPHLDRFRCSLDLEDVRFSQFTEPRQTLVDKTRFSRAMQKVKAQVARKQSNQNELFSRFDIHQGSIGYGKNIHCDRANRLISLVLYFCDADEIGLSGGDLFVYKHKVKKDYGKYERHPKVADTEVVASFRPKENFGLFFLCCNNSYHGVSPITAQQGYRNFIYINLSSRAPSIW